MLLIQILIVLSAAYSVVRTFLRFWRGSLGLKELVLWTCFWVAVVIVVLAPQITQWFARLLGVGRGADAVFYVGLLALSNALFRIYLRIRQVEQQLTRLVRKLALEEALEDEKK
jgi:hypothetical protein